MAKPNTAKGTKFRILMGNGASPQVFAALCGLTAKSINFQTQTNDFYVPDCTNPDDPAWREITKSGKSATISGQGTLNMDSHEEFFEAWEDPDSRSYRVELNVGSVNNGGYWAGLFNLTQYNVTGNDGELITAELTLESDGPIVWVPAV